MLNVDHTYCSSYVLPTIVLTKLIFMTVKQGSIVYTFVDIRRCHNSLSKSQFVTANHYRAKYGLQHGAVAQKLMNDPLPPKKYK